MPFECLKTTPRSVILDTDIGPDCDDVGAIALLLSYAEDLQFPVAGICNCTSNIHGTATLDALLSYCGHGEIPLGMYSKSGFMEKHEKYNRYIAEHFSDKFQSGALQYLPHVAFYRSLLAKAEDRGVILVTIGMFNCLSDLLNSPPDEYSQLSGRDLVAKKVYALVSMAAGFPEGREFNVFCDGAAAKNVFENCPVPIFLSDYVLGKSIVSGFSEEMEQTQESNPIFKSYQLYTKDNPHKENYKNPSYDLTAVQFACEGEGDIYGLTNTGRLEFYNADPQKYPNADATRFVEDAEGNIRFLTKNIDDASIAKMLEERVYRFNINFENRN
ncbi:MAG: nucleoside hydrolase [Clostridia bacterium]|nr:nucleoside hydrolase [Clostridia bacterium]